MSDFLHQSQKIIESGVAQDEGDRAESSYTKDFLLSLSDSERKNLKLIDEALKRIKENTLVNARCAARTSR